ncbi:hypothetical protein GEMRC1_006528 [Eukaryota sp. GEM-RC1]
MSLPPKSTRRSTAIPCRNVQLHGYCKDQDTCTFSHALSFDQLPGQIAVLQPRRSQSSPSSPRSRSSSFDLSAPSFVPKRESRPSSAPRLPPAITSPKHHSPSSPSFLSKRSSVFTLPDSLRHTVISNNKIILSQSETNTEIRFLQGLLTNHFGLTLDWLYLDHSFSFSDSIFSKSKIFKFVCQRDGLAYTCRFFNLSTLELQMPLEIFDYFDYLFKSDHPLFASPIKCFYDNDLTPSGVLFCHYFEHGTSLKKILSKKSILSVDLIYDLIVSVLNMVKGCHSHDLYVGIDTSRLLCCDGRFLMTSIGVYNCLESRPLHSDFVGLARVIGDCLGVSSNGNFLENIKIKGNYDLFEFVSQLMDSNCTISSVLNSVFIKDLQHVFMLNMLKKQKSYYYSLSIEHSNGRLLKLLAKLSFVISENLYVTNSQSYALRMFWKFLFESPKVDWSFVYNCLNKLDHCVDEYLFLEDVELQNAIVVSYSDLGKALNKTFELLISK